MRNLENKFALVTGAASGIGREIAYQLAARGSHCALLDIDRDGMAETADRVKASGRQTLELQCDLSQQASVEAALDQLLEEWPILDLAVNNAGVTHYSRTVEVDTETWQRMLAINLHAPIAITQRLLPTLLDRPEAHLVNVCSLLGLVGFSRFAAYSASKFGLVGYTEALRIEHLRSQLGVSAVCPGFVTTPFLDSLAIPRGKRFNYAILRRMSTTAEVVADRTIRAIRRNKGMVVVTPFAQLAWRIKRYVPQLMNLQRLRYRRAPSGPIEIEVKEGDFSDWKAA